MLQMLAEGLQVEGTLIHPHKQPPPPPLPADLLARAAAAGRRERRRASADGADTVRPRLSASHEWLDSSRTHASTAVYSLHAASTNASLDSAGAWEGRGGLPRVLWALARWPAPHPLPAHHPLARPSPAREGAPSAAANQPACVAARCREGGWAPPGAPDAPPQCAVWQCKAGGRAWAALCPAASPAVPMFEGAVAAAGCLVPSADLRPCCVPPSLPPAGCHPHQVVASRHPAYAVHVGSSGSAAGHRGAGAGAAGRCQRQQAGTLG